MSKKLAVAPSTLAAWEQTLIRYRAQLMARHSTEPLKSPPVFLLECVIRDIENVRKGKL